MVSALELLRDALPGVERISPFTLPAGGCSVSDARSQEAWHQGPAVLCGYRIPISFNHCLTYDFCVSFFIRLRMFQDLGQKYNAHEKDSSQKLSRDCKLQTSSLNRSRMVLLDICAHLKCACLMFTHTGGGAGCYGKY